MIFNFLFGLLPIVNCDTAEPWQLSFQDGASPSFNGIVDLHDQIMFYLIIIVILVAWMLGTIIIKFNTAKNPIVYKYFTHGTGIELIWTITPALVLVAIAFPSFRLLYLMDNPIFEVYYSHLLFTPVIIYDNVNAEEKSNILESNKGKAGIYMWTHLENGRRYVGSALDLSNRISDYYSSSYLKRADSYICNALVCHTHAAFSLSILE